MSDKLQKLIARSGLASRRAAEQWIVEGRVAVNGVTASLGDRADPAVDEVTVDGRPLAAPERPVVVLLHKPRGYVCTMHDPQGRPTVSQLVASIPLRLYPVGRLDFNSEGLLLMTNEGDLAHHLMHPRHHVEKCYLVRIRGHIGAAEQRRLAEGIQLEDGMTAPAKIRNVRLSGPDCWFEIVLQEGRNRQIRRMCEALGHKVLRLKRVRIGFLALGDLEPGTFRLLKDEEINRLKSR